MTTKKHPRARPTATASLAPMRSRYLSVDVDDGFAALLSKVDCACLRMRLRTRRRGRIVRRTASHHPRLLVGLILERIAKADLNILDVITAGRIDRDPVLEESTALIAVAKNVERLRLFLEEQAPPCDGARSARPPRRIPTSISAVCVPNDHADGFARG